LNRIIDANLNRATEALRTLEEISRFYLDNKALSEQLKLIRHNLADIIDTNYPELLNSRNTENDVGIDISNPTEKKNVLDVFKANIKRLQQALRVLAEFGQAEGLDISRFESARYDSYTLEKNMFKELSKKLKTLKLHDKKLYLVTDRSKFNSQDEFLDKIALALKGGVQIVQLREKNATAREFIDLGRKVKELCALYDALFIINDRVDIANIVGADGVHLGQDDIDINSARHIIGKDAIIGISTHSSEQAKKAVESGADYIGVGPVFETPTKPGRQAVGLEYVKWASQNVYIPWYAIGGINLDNVNEVINAGASRIAVVRAIINADNPESAANEFLKDLEVSYD
jgi:thiamine-phosphate pyrophosphorylase